jgi:hypothetical protein
MAQEPMTKRLMRALVAVCAATFLVASSGLVYAQADDDDDDAPDVKLLRGLLSGIGLQGQGDRGIEYRERSPLVLPPSTELPPPAGEAQPNVANWPVDQDAQRRKEARDLRKKQSAVAKPEIQGRPLRPNEMMPGAATNEGRRALAKGPDKSVGSSPPPSERLTPDQLGYKGGMFSNFFSKGETETTKFSGEPTRSTLTDPPVGYRTPSAAQPYGLTPDRAKPRAPTNYMDQRTAKDEGR